MMDHFNGRIKDWGKPNGVTPDKQVQWAIKHQT